MRKARNRLLTNSKQRSTKTNPEKCFFSMFSKEINNLTFAIEMGLSQQNLNEFYQNGT